MKYNNKHFARHKKQKNTLPLQIFSYCFMAMFVFLNELVFSLAFSIDISIYKFLFALTGGMVAVTLGSLFPSRKISFLSQAIYSCLISFVYISQHIYFYIFSTPYIFSSVKGAANAFEFIQVAVNAVKSQWYSYVFYILLLVVFFIFYRYAYYKSPHLRKTKLVLLPVTIVLVFLSFFLPISMTKGMGSPRYLILNEFIPQSSAKTLGAPVCMMLDLRYMMFDQVPFVISTSTPNGDETEITPTPTATPDGSDGDGGDATATPEPVVYNPQTMDIDFNLFEENSTYLEMNAYFSDRAYTMENEYTGMFEGKNLILITAEGYSDKLLDPVLTPTLYKMQNEGFKFENFYTPIWVVSTSDGEFVGTTGLIPQAGVWSYTEVADNFMPFAFGNQFNNLGYASYAFHNHSYTYYNRQLSYPNMGYDFYAKGHGLDITNVWPESDVELMEQAVPMFVNEEHFHAYMMTVSGHLEYNFNGNSMSYKNMDKVTHLTQYSDAVQAYIACNLELEYAMTDLIAQLEAAGQLENTVIVLSADHYPYGLEPSEYAELYGKASIDETFEMYENGLIIWNSEMEEPVVVDKYCSSLDIAPTVANLFNLDFDSRLYIGRDIFGTDDGLVMFLDRSYITNDYMYNANTGKVTFLTDKVVPQEEIDRMSQQVSYMFRYSGKIIEHDYYRYLFE